MISAYPSRELINANGPKGVTSAHLRDAIGETTGLAAKRFHTLQQASTMASSASELIASRLARRNCQIFSTGSGSGL